MASENLPEEKLLNLIRKQKNGAETAVRPAAAQAAPEHPQGLGDMPFVLRWVNRLLMIGALGLAGYFGYQVFVAAPAPLTVPVSDEASLQEVPVEVSTAQEEKKAEAKPFEHYAQKIQVRDIFERPKTAAPNGSEPSRPVVAEKLKVVGIVLGSVPEAIVEDAQAGQTVFLSPGDMINGAEVLRIEEGQVVLSYQGEEMVLKQ